MDQVRKMELLKPRIQPVQENELTTEQRERAQCPRKEETLQRSLSFSNLAL